MTGHRYWKRLSAICSVAVCIAGCAMVGNNESQLFSRASRYESASITYRVAPVAPGSPPTGVVLASYQTPSAPVGSTYRKTTLAIRYPHPAGRAGFARVELIVQAGKSAETETSTWMPGWLDRVRRAVNEAMPGVSMSAGVQEALALDLGVADLDRVVARLQQPIQPVAGAARTREVLIVAKINGTQLALPNAPVAELDGLIARVRREGSLISHSSATMDWEIDLPASTSAPEAASAVVPAIYTEPAIERLPPVDIIAR